MSGSCPYGKRCCFIHTELPAAGGATPQDAPPPAAPRPDGRARSLSTNSDPNEGGVSLLARISAKRNQDSTTPVDMNSTNGYQFTRPPTGSLRVDTSTLDAAASMKQNKSAYPAFASNGVLLPNVDHKGAKSPAPVTAGPDLGRHNNSRMEIVGYNQVRRCILASSFSILMNTSVSTHRLHHRPTSGIPSTGQRKSTLPPPSLRLGILTRCPAIVTDHHNVLQGMFAQVARVIGAASLAVITSPRPRFRMGQVEVAMAR